MLPAAAHRLKKSSQFYDTGRERMVFLVGNHMLMNVCRNCNHKKPPIKQFNEQSLRSIAFIHRWRCLDSAHRCYNNVMNSQVE